MKQQPAFPIALMILAVSLSSCSMTNLQQSSKLNIFEQTMAGDTYLSRLKSALESSPPKKPESPFEMMAVYGRRPDLPEPLPKDESERKKAIEDLNDKLAKLQKTNGKNSLALVPVMVKLIIASNSDSTIASAYLDRCLSICDDASRGTPIPAQALNAAASLHSLCSPNADYGVVAAYDPRVLKPALLLKIKAGGLNPDSRSTLSFLCIGLMAKSESKEACQLIELAMDYDKKNNKDTFVGEYPLKGVYALALKASGRDKEAAAIQDEFLALQKAQQAQLAVEADKELEKARKRAEIDPYGLVQATLHSATLHLNVQEKTKALELFNEVLPVYKKLPGSSEGDDLDRVVAEFVRAWLKAAEKKVDEQVIYTFLDTAEERAAQGLEQGKALGHGRLPGYARLPGYGGIHGRSQGFSVIDQLCHYYSNLHRLDDESALLKYVIEKRKELRPDDTEAIEQVTSRLSQLYEQCGLSQDATELKKVALADAERKYGKQDPHIFPVLVETAMGYQEQQHSEEAAPLMDRAASMIPDLEPADKCLTNLHNVVDYFSSQHELAKADKLLRAGYGVLRSTDDNYDVSSARSGLEQSLRKLVDKFSAAGEFESAESLIAFDRDPKNGFRGDDTTWPRQLSDLYLRHAAQMKKRGKLSESKRLLALSNTEFEKEVERTDRLHREPAFSNEIFSPENLKKHRQSQLEQLDLSDRKSAPQPAPFESGTPVHQWDPSSRLPHLEPRRLHKQGQVPLLVPSSMAPRCVAGFPKSEPSAKPKDSSSKKPLARPALPLFTPPPLDDARHRKNNNTEK